MQDGTVNVHTIKDGQFVRTLMPIDCTGPSINITFIALSYQGKLASQVIRMLVCVYFEYYKIINCLQYTHVGHIAFSAVDDTSHSVHVYSINGAHLGSKYVSGRVTGLTTANDYLVVADDAGDITMSRLYGYEAQYYIQFSV